MAGRGRRLSLLVAVLMIVAAACGGDGDGDGGGGGGGGGGVASEKPNDPLVIGIRQVGEIFDPTSVLPAEISAVFANTTEWMFQRDDSGELVGGLAEEFTVAEDSLSIDVRLRQGVKFHSGHDFDADDVVFSWERLKANGFSSRVSRTLTIEVVDPHRLTLRFAAPEVGFLPTLGFPIVSADYHAEVGEDQFKAQPVGTGPYRFVKLEKGEYVDLEAYEEYWGGAPEVKSVRMKFVTEDTTRVAQLQTGEADLIMQTPFPKVESLKDDGFKTAELSPGGSSVFVAFKAQADDTPWKDPKVREAITLAINREDIVNEILGGIPQSYPFLAPTDLGYDESIEHYPYDPERAKELLAEAGFEDGFDIDLPYISGAVVGMKETAEAVALYLEQVGITAKPMPLEGPRFVEFALKSSKDPNADYIAVFIGAIAGRHETSTGILNSFSAVTPFAWYDNPEVNGKILQMVQMVDREERGEAIQEITKAIHEDHGFVPLWTTTNVYTMKDCIEFTPTLGDIDLMLLQDISLENC